MLSSPLRRARQIASRTGRLPRLVRGLDEALSSLFQRTDALTERANVLDRRVGAVDGRLNAIDSQLNAIDSQLNAIDSQLNALDGLAKALRDLTDGYGTIVATLEGLQSQLSRSTEVLANVVPSLNSIWSHTGNLEARLDFAQSEVARLQAERDEERSRLDVDAGVFAKFDAYRASDSYARIFREEYPLVSVTIPTYNRAKLLTERCLPSVLGQDYPSLEVIVVGDACTDETQELVENLGDPRLTFVNLSQRSTYTKDPRTAWMVLGAAAARHGIELANGPLLTHLDDDDEYMPGRIRELVATLRDEHADLVWHPFLYEDQRGNWLVSQATEFRRGMVTSGSILYHTWLRIFLPQETGHLALEPGDWQRFRKIKYLGANLVRHPAVLLRHYGERPHPPL